MSRSFPELRDLVIIGSEGGGSCRRTPRKGEGEGMIPSPRLSYIVLCVSVIIPTTLGAPSVRLPCSGYGRALYKPWDATTSLRAAVC